MVKRTDAIVARDIVKANEPDTQSLPPLLSSRNRETSLSDDLIVSLSDAYENKRARQVVEWDRLAKRQYL